jgi:hypothetical protein
MLPTIGGRDTISALVGSRSRQTFTSLLTLSPLSTEDTTFTCRAVARPPAGSGFITMSEIGQKTVNISVESELHSDTITSVMTYT